MGQQKLAFVVFDCLIKNYVFALVEDFLNAVESKCCSLWTRIPLVFVWSGPLDQGRGGLILSVYARVYLYMFRICSIFVYVRYTLYLHIFYGISSLESKEIASPQTNPGFASSLSDISFPNLPVPGNEEVLFWCPLKLQVWLTQG